MLIPFEQIEDYETEWDSSLKDRSSILMFAPTVNKYTWLYGVYIKETNEIVLGITEKQNLFGIKPEQVTHWTILKD